MQDDFGLCMHVRLDDMSGAPIDKVMCDMQRHLTRFSSGSLKQGENDFSKQHCMEHSLIAKYFHTNLEWEDIVTNARLFEDQYWGRRSSTSSYTLKRLHTLTNQPEVACSDNSAPLSHAYMQFIDYLQQVFSDSSTSWSGTIEARWIHMTSNNSIGIIYLTVTIEKDILFAFLPCRSPKASLSFRMMRMEVYNAYKMLKECSHEKEKPSQQHMA